MRTDGRRPLRVLAADDSAVMRGVLRTIFQLHADDRESELPPMDLCGVVRDGIEALEAVAELRPDVLLLDLEMPRLNGLGVLERLQIAAASLPVIICSAHTERGARSTLDALAGGAKDYVMKPSHQSDFASALDFLMQQLLPKIAALAGRSSSGSQAPSLGRKASEDRSLAKPNATPGGAFTNDERRVEVVVIGVSTGGPSALEVLLPMLPKDFAVPVMIVQHMPKLFTGALADRLNRLCALRVIQAHDGEAIEPGVVFLAPGDAHMEIAGARSGRSQASGSVVNLHQGAPLNSCMPSVDYLFRSAARVYGPGSLALVMTGMGSDGLAGARAVHQAGGTILAQDEASSAVWGMPRRVIEAGIASSTLPLGALAAALIERVQDPKWLKQSEHPGIFPLAPNWKELSYGLL